MVQYPFLAPSPPLLLPMMYMHPLPSAHPPPLLKPLMYMHPLPSSHPPYHHIPYALEGHQEL